MKALRNSITSPAIIEFVGIRLCSEQGTLIECRFREGAMWSKVYGLDFGGGFKK